MNPLLPWPDRCPDYIRRKPALEKHDANCKLNARTTQDALDSDEELLSAREWDLVGPYRRGGKIPTRWPCMDDALMNDTPPVPTWENLKKPRLRRCPFDLEDITWLEKLGYGIDGFVWKVKFKDETLYALKLFWDSERPKFYYWSFNIECQVATLLQTLRGAIAKPDPGPIRVRAKPISRRQAIVNLHAFSDEGRSEPLLKDAADCIEVSEMPRTRKCYGWLKIKSEDAGGMKLKPGPIRMRNWEREVEPGQTYYAIVYEYIPEAENDLERVAATLDFCWRAGLEASSKIDNWSDGVLLDMSDLIPPLVPERTHNHCRASIQTILGY